MQFLIAVVFFAVLLSLTEIMRSNSVVVSRFDQLSNLAPPTGKYTLDLGAPRVSVSLLGARWNIPSRSGAESSRDAQGRFSPENMRETLQLAQIATFTKLPILQRNVLIAPWLSGLRMAKTGNATRPGWSRTNEAPSRAGDERLFMTFTLFFVCILLSLYVIGLCGTLRKCGYPAWFGLMPFTGPLALCEAGGNVWLWVLPRLFTNPPFSTTANAILCYGVAVAFLGKRAHDESRGLGAGPSPTSIWDDFTWKAFWLTVGLVLVPFIAFPLLALTEALQYDARYRARLAEQCRSS
ncbi:hypothetical protein F1559_002142 [Cyanidiococcus yangmingshanensis]|uniref:Uncharacterized protein n=1 Tax=Cyanidiococcus yangmingshanensis TaxID=2690220 RepID=A0A7J7IE89_9RHOD|nr:hypothetical protein F1559_002142 [Cyanidiococcus yangmingshanensis]